ncbi:MAG TPA: CAP domain-containing protein [Thermoanaerobaculia bacterium]|nr:CAP domain-containing protein [Thermoanaerobaculia bacterium]
MIEKRRTHPVLLALAALLLAAAGPQPVAPPQDPEMVRRDLTLLLNRDRELAGVPLLAPSGPLHAVAQKRAEAIQAHGGLPDEAEAMNLFRQIQTQLAKAGYSAQGWAESITTAPAGLEAAFEAWKREDPSYAQAMNVDYQNVGVGVAELGGHPLYVFLFAWPRSEYFARETAGLTDLQAVRQEMLDRINKLREATGLRPLELDPRLNTAAQAHAADMLARTYYNHVSPEGTTASRRVQAAGFAADLVAENIAAGKTSVDDVLGAWLHSTGHRKNLMDARLTHIGIGMAVGSYDSRYRVLWVQDFGRQQVWR